MRLKSLMFVLLAAIGLMLVVTPGCKKDNPLTDNATIDPALLGVWYSAQTAFAFGVPGFEILSDGSTKNLLIDSTGKIQYAPASVDSVFKLTLESAKGGLMKGTLRVKIPGTVDTTAMILAPYALSNNNSTLTLTLPDPSSGQLVNVVFTKSAIGAAVGKREGGEE
ncbi:MAG: hypothetical protein WBD36_14590 [Bacteroidota bacterium]